MIIDLHAHFHSDSALYPDREQCYFSKIASIFRSDSGLVRTVVFIPTVVYILTVVSSLSDYSPHSYFHVIFITAYPALRVKFYAYINMH